MLMTETSDISLYVDMAMNDITAKRVNFLLKFFHFEFICSIKVCVNKLFNLTDLHKSNH